MTSLLKSNKPKNNLKTKIFLDSGDPQETKEVLEVLGFLDGQTTNPSLISKNPEITHRIKNNNKFGKLEILDFYKQTVQAISKLIPGGSVSIEVYADLTTTFAEMYDQAIKMYSWIPNAHIKFPTNQAGLLAAHKFNKEGGRVNMTLVFNQQQAGAIYSATRGQKGDIFASPFVGRLDDIGFNGLDLIQNCLKMFQNSDQHVQVLASSIRTIEQFLSCLKMHTDIITAPKNLLLEWYKQQAQPSKTEPNQANLKSIPYQNLDLRMNWEKFDLSHDLTNLGIQKFAQDWNKLITT
jgi:transaldolase